MSFRECSVNQCTRPAKTRGMCGAHAERVRTGRPLESPIRKPVPDFSSLYVKAATGCWDWVGPISSEGYGRYRSAYAHRVSYELHVGPIPAGLQIDHLCRNRRCCNPEHLEAVTQRENLLRGMAPGSVTWRTGTCARGHQMTFDNTYTAPGGNRRCRACVSAAEAGDCPHCGNRFASIRHHLRLVAPRCAK